MMHAKLTQPTEYGDNSIYIFKNIYIFVFF